MTTRFRAGDRVRIRPDMLAAWCGRRTDRLAAWRARVGTVMAKGLTLGTGRCLYVVWDGNTVPRVAWDEYLEPVAKETTLKVGDVVLAKDLPVGAEGVALDAWCAGNVMRQAGESLEFVNCKGSIRPDAAVRIKVTKLPEE